MLAGYCLRPGYGYFDDEARINEVWRLFELGLDHKKEPKVFIQWCIFWRRISGGLSKMQQEKLFETLRKVTFKEEGIKKEIYRTLSVLELVGREKKDILAKDLIKFLTSGKIEESYAWSFGRLCSRVPLSGLRGEVVPPSVVEDLFCALEASSWNEDSFYPLAKSMILAARVSENENLNLNEDIRLRIADKVLEAGLDINYRKVFKEYLPLEAGDESVLFGENLPLGLELF